MRFLRNNPLAVIFILFMAYQSFTSGQFSDPIGWLMFKLLILPGILIGLSFHEFAHAVAAYALGDKTPKIQGRVTINPIAHIDFFGFIALIFIGFGWGKPVVVNPRNFKHMRRDGLIVDLAGVTLNLILAILFAGLYKFLIVFQLDFLSTYMGSVVATIIYYVVYMNVILMIFNLLPIPPLDGFGIITEVFDLRKKSFYYPLYQNGFMILLVFMIFNITGKLLNPPFHYVFGAIQTLYGIQF